VVGDRQIRRSLSHRNSGRLTDLLAALHDATDDRRQIGTTRMTYEDYNAFCRALPATSYVLQWGGSHVWKVGGKVFAIGGWGDDEPSFTFKVSDIAYEILKDQPGLRPAPYLASRGMKWIQHFAKPGLADEGLRDYIRESHSIVSRGLSKKMQIALGLAAR
jgi:predicted DNA-binding protein (MmcQ/YjbR family)